MSRENELISIIYNEISNSDWEVEGGVIRALSYTPDTLALQDEESGELLYLTAYSSPEDRMSPTEFVHEAQKILSPLDGLSQSANILADMLFEKTLRLNKTTSDNVKISVSDLKELSHLIGQWARRVEEVDDQWKELVKEAPLPETVTLKSGSSSSREPQPLLDIEVTSTKVSLQEAISASRHLVPM